MMMSVDLVASTMLTHENRATADMDDPNLKGLWWPITQASSE